MLRLPLLLLLAPLSVLSLPISSSTLQLIFQFPDQRVENLAVRSNGHLLLTFDNEPYVYDLDPTAQQPAPTLVHQFSGVSSTVGIAETSPDIFAVITGNASDVTLLGVPGSFSLWSVDLNPPEPTAKLITSIPEADSLNGLTTLNGSPDIVLIADSTLGAVWRVNIVTGDYSIAIQSPFFTPSSNSSIPGRGINGVHTFGGMLYFTNSAQETFGRVTITNDGSASGEVEILGVPLAAYDDFAFDGEGNAWIATHPNSLSEVNTEGELSNISNNTDFSQPTAVNFGRGSMQEKNTLYMTTYGSTTGGSVIAINV
ncbi:MAG: hypothetical protein ASARMPRED_009352 [Alectoria sarmentosa]|nr:MAG: hypothetical protein ASARMPRED_009352 [Alectoria sarmentosa]